MGLTWIEANKRLTFTHSQNKSYSEQGPEGLASCMGKKSNSPYEDIDAMAITVSLFQSLLMKE